MTNKLTLVVLEQGNDYAFEEAYGSCCYNALMPLA